MKSFGARGDGGGKLVSFFPILLFQYQILIFLFFDGAFGVCFEIVEGVHVMVLWWSGVG